MLQFFTRRFLYEHDLSHGLELSAILNGSGFFICIGMSHQNTIESIKIMKTEVSHTHTKSRERQVIIDYQA